MVFRGFAAEMPTGAVGSNLMAMAVGLADNRDRMVANSPYPAR